MKHTSFTKYLPLGTLCAGILGALLRTWLYASGTDEKGLLIPGHPANILTWLLTGAVTGLLVYFSLPLKEGKKFRFNFPASINSAVGCLAAALGIFVDAMGHLGGTTLQNITGFLGIFSTMALVFISHCRLKGRYPSVLFNALICLYLMLRLVGLYQTWSAAPQLQDYVFPLLGCVAVMLACYHDAAFAANAGSRQRHTFYHMMAVYLCLTSLPHNDSYLFHLTLSAWMLTGHCNLTPMARKTRPAAVTAEPAVQEPVPAQPEPVTLEKALGAEPRPMTLEESFAALESFAFDPEPEAPAAMPELLVFDQKPGPGENVPEE